MKTGLVALTFFACLDVFLDVLHDLGPVYTPSELVVRLLEPQVARDGGIVGIVQKRKADVSLLRYTDKCLIAARYTEEAFMQRIARWATSLKAALIDRADFGIIRVTIYQALP